MCEQCDIKCLIAKARRGELKGFTGIYDPYEESTDPELIFSTLETTPEENARMIVSYLTEKGFLL